jgi:Fe-S-cluster-containing dehydrogenase component
MSCDSGKKKGRPGEEIVSVRAAQTTERPLLEATQDSALLSRRRFLRLSLLTASGLVLLGPQHAYGGASLVIIENAKFVILAEPGRCVGCGRCELACTEFNDGVAQPSLSRIKVLRNLAFGPTPFGGAALRGQWGDGLIIQDACRQCAHPVPCAEACPNEAIVEDPKTGARMVDPDRCVGCRLCLSACPWAMMSFNEATSKATKCFLCHGAPKCVEACPSEALRLIPWRDLGRDAPPRVATATALSPEKKASCQECHK